MVKPFVRSPYNYDAHQASIDSGLSCPEPTRTQQQFKEECDINVITDRFGLTGQLPEHFTLPLEGDFTEVVDYQSALNRINEANAGFMLMPAAVRERFANDPHKFVAFCSDPANGDEARKMGLRRPETARPAPIEVSVIPPPPSPAPPPPKA